MHINFKKVQKAIEIAIALASATLAILSGVQSAMENITTIKQICETEED